MSGRNLGVNVIGRYDHLEMYAGDFPRVTSEVLAGQDLKAGSIVRLIAGNNVVGIVDSMGPPVFGITAHDMKENEVGTVYLTGKFAGACLHHGSTSLTWRNFIEFARSRSIFLAEIYQG